MPRRLRLYEHGTVRVDQPVEGGHFRQADFDALARYNDGPGKGCFRLGFRSVTATQHVGYVEVGDLAIEILPKADRRGAERSETTWRDALLEMLRVATGIDLWTPTPASQQATRHSLMELVAARFASEVEMLVHAGLARSYREEEANEPVLRGKLLFAQHLVLNAARQDRFYVRQATFDRDIPVNRLLAAALDVLERRPFGGGLPGRLRALRMHFDDFTPITVTPSTFDRIRYGRSTDRYRPALLLARMILEQLAPSLRSGPVPVFALLFDMNDLWERYVASLLRVHAAGRWTVSTQESRAFWGSQHVRPDIVVRDTRTKAMLFVADTKWKVPEGGKPDPADLKQMFAYNELLGCERAVLLYPSTGGDQAHAARFVSRTHSCETAFLSVPRRGTGRSDVVAELFGPLSSAPPGARGDAGRP